MVERVAILGTSGGLSDYRQYSDEDFLQIIGGNVGNFMFQYGASKIVDAEELHIGLSGVPYSSGEIGTAQLLIFPAANHLRVDADWTQLCNWLEGTALPMAVLGLGAQSPGIEDEARIIEALKQNASVMRMVKLIRDRARFVTLRGDFTARVCEALGLTTAAVLGCPSAMISEDPEIGLKVRAKLTATSGLSRPMRLGVAAGAPFEIEFDARKLAVERKLLKWAMANDALYFQQSGGVEVLKMCMGRRDEVAESIQRHYQQIVAPDISPQAFFDYLDRRARVPMDVEAWIAETVDLDLVVGTRLHGNMAALAAGTPGAIITHDSRTIELAQTMMLPRLTMDALLEVDDIGQLAAAVTFSGSAFDQYRANAARTLISECARIGLSVRSYLYDLILD